ncbi:mediator of RNA polymerase II transcription subunit 13 isoform X3 [Homalodisca vitripennis]|uniref:mediator of RNA polymerase II transcription subunit 13 isoform X3 n=1 Tax=Homalodisca vitripennis TaxID=197043 RepID=UPI001EECC82D|nr:mediator of RNA polymerase II transcription subunit 13 isoform X3 [Homalodisca vitripennis]
MTHQSHQTNGASLEDCHTNFFALTELCGIKWRKLVWGEAEGLEPLEDPVLSSFSRCLAGDILCVWRRVSSQPGQRDMFDPLGLPQPPAGPQHPPLSLAAAKELWIFWYGEEPDLSGIVSQELLATEGEQGSWESGLSYECRSLLFKALHNLIERCLLSRDFVRLGKWFVQPYDGSEKKQEKSGHLSFSFAFFVHGESTVCASVDVRQHHPVRTLIRAHLQQAQACLHSGTGVQVILAPYGMAGTLTGQSFKALDAQTQRLMDDWKHFYPTRDVADLPSAVEVIVGGVKLRYPSCYVLVTDMDETTSALINTQPGGIKSSLPCMGLTVSVVGQHQQHPECMVHASTPSTVLPERAWQDSTISLTPGPTSPTPTDPPVPPAHWDFQDPTRKQNCSCPKLTSAYGQQSTPHHHQNDSLPVASVGSPASVAPSPLPNPQSQPASVPPADPTMPTLSPQPPPPHHHPPAPSPLEDKVVCTPDGHFHGPKSVSSINQVFSPYPSALSVEGVKALDSVGGPGSAPPPVSGPASAPQPPPSQEPPPPTLKRPVLSSKEYETILQEEEQPSNLLYDYASLEAWLNHPVKRFKPTEPRPEPNRGPTFPQYTPPAPSPPHQHYIKQEQPGVMPFLQMEVDAPSGGGLCKRSDPYEFDEDGTAPMEGFNRNQAGQPIKEECDKKGLDPAALNGPRLQSSNLFTKEAIEATSFNDLDQIFDNSDDTSSDEAGLIFQVQMPTPPGSNKAGDDFPGTLVVRPPRGSGGVRPEELSKMFPTPPSHEHNPISSPCGGHLGDTPVHEPPDFLPLPRVKQEYHLGSPQHEPIEDWSYVFRPPQMWKFVGSSKYAPLTNLPSQNLPPITMPSHCVYKPSWLYPHHQDKPTSHMNNMLTPVHQPPRSTGPPLRGMSPYPASPMSWRAPPTQPPPPYSPAQPPSLYKSRPPEANSLVVNILLGDTALNIFRDHNFDSCTLCVCNAGPKVVGNIRGADAGVYLPTGPPFSGGVFSPAHHPQEDDPIRCSCGFSAVVNRRLSHRSGLFLEDEMEITGLIEEREETNHPGLVGAALGVMDLVRQQCVVVHSASNSLYRAARQHRPLSAPPSINLLEFGDGNHVTLAALEQGRLASAHTDSSSVSMCKVEEMAARHCGKVPAVHRWPYTRARGPRCNQDIVRIMRSLQPLLQDAIQKKCTTRMWDAPYTVSGPLTWRQFHRLAGRGTDDRCEPQPIPKVMVGHEKDWLSVAPYSLHYWEKLLLEPYSYARDIAYVVVAPDNDYVLGAVRSFFRELSSTYEMCRLGRHCPITKVLRDGILRVGNKAAIKLAKEPVDEWFTMLGDNSTTNMLKLYAQVCRYHLAPHLSQVVMDRSLLDPPEGNCPPRPTPTPSPMPPPSTPDSQDRQPSTPKSSDQEDSGRGESCSSGDSSHEEDNGEPPALVVYLVEPFTLGSDSSDLQRLACLGLLRCFNNVLAALPDNIKANITLQIISLESIVELGRSGDRKRRNDHMRATALSVFSQCRRQLQHQTNMVKALTGFGTAACTDLFLKTKDEKNRSPYKVYTPPYILAKGRGREGGGGGGEGDSLSSEQLCSVLYVSYCLSEDQRFLLASATDEQGHLLETATINVHIPNRSRRRKASARRIGLQKLMDFILGVMSQGVTPWRLVVGRVGRIGHGELKGWSWLLSRKSLLKASKHLKEICGQCSLSYPHDVPCILSACLVSLEPDSCLRLMPDQFTPDERFSQQSVKCQLSTPQDVTCTHILVFPTSATTQSSQTAFQEQQINGPDLGDDELFNALNDDMPEGMGDFNDIFSQWPETEAEAGGVRSPGGSPRGRGGDSSQAGSPSCMTGPDDHHSPYPCNGPSRSGEVSEEVGTLLQQPLALGYLVSTAPTGRMPRWFWTTCPHLETACPAFLKNALHLHSTAIQQNSEELLQQQSNVAGHPLDSQYTTDVLRYVLEGYNSLSWLALDSNTHDRLSCLPVHMQILMQLYHMTSALV